MNAANSPSDFIERGILNRKKENHGKAGKKVKCKKPRNRQKEIEEKNF